MERVSLIVVLVAALFMGGGAALANPPGAAGQGKAPSANAPAKNKAKKKETREGSYIMNNMPMPDPPDLRGTYERQRDDELMTHFGRLARLDYIEELAEQSNDTRLIERVENVRRREVQRHRGAMTHFWEQSRGRAMVGFQ